MEWGKTIDSLSWVNFIYSLKNGTQLCDDFICLSVLSNSPISIFLFFLISQEIDISVQLTAGHLGYFEFRICSLDSSFSSEDEECFDKNLLQLSNGEGTKYPIPTTNAANYTVSAVLPSDLECQHCVLQWHYTAGIFI